MDQPAVGVMVWVVIYHHKYGIDFWVTSTEEKAQDSILEIMNQWIHDVEDEDHRKKIQFLIESKQYLPAMKDWTEATDEAFTFEQRTVDSTGNLGEIT